MNWARIRLGVKAVTPPLLWNAAKALKDRRAPAPPPAAEPERAEALAPPPDWEWVPEGWARAQVDERVKGWDVAAIAASYREKWPSFVRALDGPGPLGVYHEVPAGMEVSSEDEVGHNLLVSFAYVLARAARAKERLSVLDWGGGSGHYHLVARAALPEVELEYHVKDVPALVELGRELVPEVEFHVGDSALGRTYDLVLASGSLQYSEEWRDALAALGAAAAPWLYVTRLPVAREAASFVVVQRPYAYGYETEYLGWVLNRDELLTAAADAGLTLEREFLLLSPLEIPGAPERRIEHRGFLFRRAS